MKIEKINDKKLKIIFDSKELEENNISVHSFLSNSLESQKLFLAILDIANEDLDFDTTNSQISYETFSFDNTFFVIFITKSKINSNSNILLESDYNNYNNLLFLSRDNCNSQTSSFNFVGNKLSNIQNKCKYNNSFFYFFNDMEDVFQFCNFIQNNYLNKDLNSSLYKYNNLFFIEINFGILPQKDITRTISIISEIKDCYNLSELSVRKLKEYSKLLIKNNTIQVL